jgi:hypothetical protein
LTDNDVPHFLRGFHHAGGADKLQRFLIGSGGVTKHKPQPRHRHMVGRLNIRWPAESVQQALSDQRDFRARLTRPLRDRSRSVLSADRRFLKRWPSSIFSTGHRFPDLASDDLGLRNRTVWEAHKVSPRARKDAKRHEIVETRHCVYLSIDL